jgi:phage terminase small subunit
MSLTEKQQRFVDYYLASGNAEEAATKAGYNARGNTTKLLQNTTIQKAIKERNKVLESARIANMEEVKELWTNILRNNGMDVKDRLKASEYIAKTNGAFIEKQHITGGMTINLSPEERRARIDELISKRRD